MNYEMDDDRRLNVSIKPVNRYGQVIIYRYNIVAEFVQDTPRLKGLWGLREEH